jgi:hypothetical protein
VAGKPVIVYAARGTGPWEDCEVCRRGSGPKWTPHEIILSRFATNGNGRKDIAR